MSKDETTLRRDFNELRRAHDGLLRKSGAVQWYSFRSKRRVRRGRGEKWLSDMSEEEAFEVYNNSTR